MERCYGFAVAPPFKHGIKRFVIIINFNYVEMPCSCEVNVTTTYGHASKTSTWKLKYIEQQRNASYY